jgi:hypothetical protein
MENGATKCLLYAAVNKKIYSTWFMFVGKVKVF